MQKIFIISSIILIVIILIVIVVVKNNDENFWVLNPEIDNAMIMAIDYKYDDDKLKNLTEQLNQANVNYRVYKAINGNVIDINKLVFEGIGNSYEPIVKIRDNLMSQQQYACFMSHLNIWEIFLQTQRNYCVVLGDNIKLTNNFKIKLAKVLEDLNDTNLDGVLLSDASICQQQFSEKCNSYYVDYPTIIHPVYLGKSCPAYILTREGARKLINHTIPISMPVDTFFNQLNFNKTINIGRTKKPLVTVVE